MCDPRWYVANVFIETVWESHYVSGIWILVSKKIFNAQGNSPTIFLVSLRSFTHTSTVLPQRLKCSTVIRQPLFSGPVSSAFCCPRRDSCTVSIFMYDDCTVERRELEVLRSGKTRTRCLNHTHITVTCCRWTFFFITAGCGFLVKLWMPVSLLFVWICILSNGNRIFDQTDFLWVSTYHWSIFFHGVSLNNVI